MKKNGFTLAEVLITLAIIGVVATLTLPALMSNTQEQQAVTAFKKAMNTLNEVAQMNAVIDGFDYSGVTSDANPATNESIYSDIGALNQSIWAMMRSKAQVDENASVTGGIPGECNGLKQIFFRDGTVLCYDNAQQAGTQAAFIQGIIDTNGQKGPNTISSCGDASCLNKGNKHIRDQFRITLYGANAVPGHITIAENTGNITEDDSDEGRAARWAMRK